MSQARRSCEFRFYAELNSFLPPPRRQRALACRLRGSPTVKAAIEAQGVPPSQVDLVLVNGKPVGLRYRVHAGDRIAVYPVFESLDITGTTRVRARPLRKPRFVCDPHLPGLARRLRELGLDVTYARSATTPAIVRTAVAERRIILTRDQAVLRARGVTHGILLWSGRVAQQVEQVLERLDLRGLTKTWRRRARRLRMPIA